MEAAKITATDSVDGRSSDIIKKLQLKAGKDLYKLAPSSWEDEPATSYPYIVKYLVYSPSPYTAEDV